MTPLHKVFEGWDGYQTSLVRAIAPLTAEQLAFRINPEMRSVGEIAAHIATGRVDWFRRMSAPGSEALTEQMAPWWQPGDEADRDAGIIDNAAALVHWLEATWEMVAETLNNWTTDDLSTSYEHPYRGSIYAISYQWTIWRIMCHDIQHGGQITELLAAQGIYPLELTLLGGHLTEPPILAPE